jgi:hypothetical protein
MTPDPLTPNPLAWNPFAVLGLPEWPDLDDETVHAAWQQIAAETHPDRDDGGNLARFTQATAAYNELCCPWGRSEAFADLLDQAWAEGRYDPYPGCYPPGYQPYDPADLPPSLWQDTGLGPVPLSEILHMVGEIPARFRRGHPVHLAIRAAVFAGLCLAALALFHGWAAGFGVYLLIGTFVLSSREDMAPPARPVRRLPPTGKERTEKRERERDRCLRRGLGLQDGPGPREAGPP